MNKLEPSAAALLNNLVEICRDGYIAYQEAMSHIQAAELKGYFNLVSQERLRFGRELLLELFKSDAELCPRDLSNLERPLPWQVARHRLNGQGDQFILRELARLEEYSLKLYETALHKAWPAELRALLEGHCAEVKRVHEHVQAACAAALKRLSVTAASRAATKRRTPIAHT